MRKQITSILLVAGTCIGGGTIALPMVLAKLGIIPSLAIMVLVWLLTYYTSLVSVELNLHLDRGLSLGALGKVFSGNTAAAIGEISVKLLSYALLSVYIYGGASIIQKLIEVYFQCSISNIIVETCLTALTAIVLLFPMKTISTLNNIAFVIFAFIFLALIGVISSFVDLSNMPWIVNPSANNAASVITVIFCSFGYQVIFHTLRDYCGRDAKIQRRIFFFGSLIPIIVYMLWTSSSLSVVFRLNPDFFVQMVAGKIDVGDLVNELASISGLQNFKILIWWVTIFAICTSIIGVGLGLSESLQLSLKNRVTANCFRKILAALITVAPAYIVAAIVPNAFIRVLGFAGAILVIIAILLPIYLFFKAKIDRPYIHELKKWTLITCALAGIGIMITEFFVNNG